MISQEMWECLVTFCMRWGLTEGCPVEGGGSGGLVAAPIASKVMDAHFAQQRSALLREDDRPLSLAVADTGNGP